ncbi:MAG TPA: alpha/beta hydrolase [Firmicutes bacterium]|jgi:pimeloyl-ACP methyl ester carboxylesterase|nr:alpha/beta hydrolase [Bacillota bacterium]
MSFIMIPFFSLLAIAVFLPQIRRTEHAEITPAVRDKASGKFILLSKGYTHYDIAGPVNGQVIVFIHGFSVPYYMWDRNFNALARAGFRVIRYDIYGRGLSDRPKVTYNRTLFVNQLMELLDSLAIKQPVNVVGNSMGGAIAVAFSADFPARVGKIILIDPLCEQMEIGLLGKPGIGEYLARSFFVPASPRKQLNDFYQPQSFANWPELFREQMSFKGFGRALLSTLRCFLSQDPSPDYWRVKDQGKQVLLIWGAEDRTLASSGATKLYRILKPDFLWVEKAGHVPQYECPELVNRRIIDFLAEGAECESIGEQA